MSDVKKTPAALILAAWIVVGVPAAWGVYNTVLNAKKLFASSPAPTTVAVPATTTK